MLFMWNYIWLRLGTHCIDFVLYQCTRAVTASLQQAGHAMVREVALMPLSQQLLLCSASVPKPAYK
eukprot:3866758-Amphidinium_carterae.1